MARKQEFGNKAYRDELPNSCFRIGYHGIAPTNYI